MMNLTTRGLSPVFLILLLIDMLCPKQIEVSNNSINSTIGLIAASQIPSPTSPLSSALGLGNLIENSALNYPVGDFILFKNNDISAQQSKDDKCSSYSAFEFSKQQKCFPKLSKNLNATTHIINSKNNCERLPRFFNATNKTKSSNHDPIHSIVSPEQILTKSSQANSSLNDTKTIMSSVPDIMLIKSSQTTNDMLSFEEWRKKISEQNDYKKESEMDTEKVNHEVEQRIVAGSEQKIKLSTNRARNFASHECGAKILSANPEATHLDKVLTELTDEYMLNPCKQTNWLVIELCETIQPQYLELANYELYSSLPKELFVYASDVYPNRNEWSLVGNFTAGDTREIQGFKLNSNGFVKYLKVEVVSYYGVQHFCPISVIRVFGTSLFDEVERIDKPQEKLAKFEQNKENALFEESLESKSDNINIIGNAKDTVLNIVKKAFKFTIFNNILWNSALVKETPEIIDITWQMKTVKFHQKFEDFIECSNCELIYSISNQNFYSTKCQFFRSILSHSVYDLLFTQYFLKQYLKIDYLFQCPTNETALSLNDFNLIDLKSKNNFTINNFSCKFADSFAVPNLLPIKNLNGTKVMENIVSSGTATGSLKNLTIEPSVILPIFQNVAKTLPLQIASMTTLKELNNYQDNNSRNLTATSVLPIEMTESLSIPNLSNELETENQNGFSSNSGQSKEAVIIRLTSKIKNLEKNISLMSTYLESLSVRYRIQMEEMQLIFNKTIDHLNTTAIRAAEKDTKQQELLTALELEITKLKIKFMNLSTTFETNNLNYTQIHIILMVIEIFLVAVVCLIVYRRVSYIGLMSNPQIQESTIVESSVEIKPKNSLEKKSKHYRSKSMPALQIEPELFDFMQQCENGPMFPKVETTAPKETDCDTENKENLLINNVDDCNIPATALCSRASKSTTSCVENILKIIN